MWRTLGVAILGGVAIEVTFYGFSLFLHYITKDPRKKRKETFFKTLFFPDNLPAPACKDHFTSRHGCSKQVCKFSHNETSSYGQLLQYLSSARKTVDVAVYCITGRELVSVLVDLHQMGVIVRVMTDDEQINTEHSQIGYLRSQGIQVRNDRTPFYMHHKYAIVDGETLINGSFNWSKSAITGNNENLTITNQLDIVDAYIKEFNKLWEEFDPKKNQPSVCAPNGF